MFVLYKNTGVHSGRALRRMLAELHSERVRGGYPKRLAGILKAGGEPGVVINLGVTDDLRYKGTVLNDQAMVRAASNKKKARQIFAERGIPAPELYLRPGDVSKDDLPVIGRTSYHRKGEGFWLCKTLASVRKAATEGATHFLEFIPSTREYRVHTFIKKKYRESTERKSENYVSVKISEKVWQGKAKPSTSKPQKNHEFGWTFLGAQNRREEELDVVRHAAKQAIAALGLDFGAVDVMYRIRSKQPYVLEVNSTPSLSDEQATTCEVYANRILKTFAPTKEK
jgi:carbamoylphosphate synthase large subunit